MRATGRGRLAAVVTALVTIVVVIVVEVCTLGGSHGSTPPMTGCRSAAPRVSVLMIGNSYTAQNNLPSVLASVLCKSAIATNVHVDSLTGGGAALSTWVDEGARDQIPGHHVVVLQDQSQTPGFGARQPAYLASLYGAELLAQTATVAHAKVVLFETWGRESGDPDNRLIYPTYDTMQQRLAAGYAGYLAALRAGPAPDAEVSPVGQTWAWVHAHDRSLFTALYAPDGSHPSVAGTYLAALVLARTISQRALPSHLWRPSGLSASRARALQAAARAG